MQSGALIRKLQHLSMSYHSELRAGKLQSKVLRDVEAIESLSKQMMYSLIPAILNVIVAISITASKNLTIAGFFVVVIPVAAAIVYAFRRSLQGRNREFRRQIEEISGQVAETVEMIPVTRAHGLDEVEIEKTDSTLQNLRTKGYRLDIAEAYFGSTGWVVFQLFQVLCLAFTCTLAYRGQIQMGDVVMYQGFFSMILGSVNGIINVYPQFPLPRHRQARAAGLRPGGAARRMHRVRRRVGRRQVDGDEHGDRVLSANCRPDRD